MEEIIKLSDKLFWVGVKDENLRVFDIVMETEFGTSYNSYVWKDGEKTVLFETAKAKTAEDFLRRVKAVTPLEKIDYIVISHTEPDHTGSLIRILEANPNATVIATKTALNFLEHIVHRPFQSHAVQDGERMVIGNSTFRFFVLPNLHWPDTMYTYIEEEQVLITCDSFGSHYCCPEMLRSKVPDEAGYQRAMKYYFDNILGPFLHPYLTNALKAIAPLKIEMICPGHGPVLDCKIDEIIEQYHQWCAKKEDGKKRAVIAYVSAYGYTGELAHAIADGLQEKDVQVEMYDLVTQPINEALAAIQSADGILLGSPTLVGDALKPIWEVAISLSPVVHAGRAAAAFGSYGWSGEAVPYLMERLRQVHLDAVEGPRVRLKPTGQDLDQARIFGREFAARMQKQKKENEDVAEEMVKCLVCGKVFAKSLGKCPVCGVGLDRCEPVE